MSVGAFSNSSEASCDSGSVVAAERGHAHLFERGEFRLLRDRRAHHDRILLAGRVLERADADARYGEAHRAIELGGLHA